MPIGRDFGDDKMEKERLSGINIGGISVILIFIVLAMTMFAVLSAVVAQADYNLTLSYQQSVDDYYQGENKAEEMLGQIDACLKENFSADQSSYWQNSQQILSAMGLKTELTGDKFYIAYQVPVNENKVLHIRLAVLSPDQVKDGRYQILSWQIVSQAGDEDYQEDYLTFWDGEID
ncbi:MAG: hypothetical protein RR396_03540 [Clostridiales bacterium]